ncbi:MAG TPA: fasciclin domain-containing protein [Vicinamibacteria bacterium]|nr:fasciclin domain-containing protein [Vicinamibacteria bacterium]
MRKRLLLAAVAILVVGLASPALAQPKDIVDTAVAAGSFKTLAKLLTDADLVAVMKGPGPYTVFAPTDEAFAKVPPDVLAGLAKDKAKLQEVLKYHVLTSKWTTDDMKLVKQTGTVQGKPVTFGVVGPTPTVNGAKVIKPNVNCTNGMIQVIDAVLLPPQ